MSGPPQGSSSSSSSSSSGGSSSGGGGGGGGGGEEERVGSTRRGYKGPVVEALSRALASGYSLTPHLCPICSNWIVRLNQDPSLMRCAVCDMDVRVGAGGTSRGPTPSPNVPAAAGGGTAPARPPSSAAAPAEPPQSPSVEPHRPPQETPQERRVRAGVELSRRLGEGAAMLDSTCRARGCGCPLLRLQPSGQTWCCGCQSSGTTVALADQPDGDQDGEAAARRQSSRQRQQRMRDEIGRLLLSGGRLLDDACTECACPLVLRQDGVRWCCGCQRAAADAGVAPEVGPQADPFVPVKAAPGRTQSAAAPEQRGGDSDDAGADGPRRRSPADEERERRRDLASDRMGRMLLEGCAMLSDTCPTAGCLFPLVRRRDGTMYCCHCEAEVRSEPEDAVPPPSERQPQPASSATSATAAAAAAAAVANSDDWTAANVQPAGVSESVARLNRLLGSDSPRGYAPRPDRAAEQIGQRLSQGWSLLDETCPGPGCDTPLVRSQDGTVQCCGCGRTVRRPARARHGEGRGQGGSTVPEVDRDATGSFEEDGEDDIGDDDEGDEHDDAADHGGRDDEEEDEERLQQARGARRRGASRRVRLAPSSPGGAAARPAPDFRLQAPDVAAREALAIRSTRHAVVLQLEAVSERLEADLHSDPAVVGARAQLVVRLVEALAALRRL